MKLFSKFLVAALLGVMSVLPSFAAAAGDGIVSGTVTNRKTAEPLTGAIVVVKGTNNYSVVDAAGNFSLQLSEKSKRTVIVQVTLMGFITEEFSATADKPVALSLVEDAEILNESQVIAYGRQSKTTLTGAISSIGTKELLRSPSGSAGAALAGAVTGVSTVQTSAQPGAEDPDIFVRGVGSITGSASKPLILVDGVERSFFQMDPNEIESITILKDASSTAVFGVRGANGVILVTTRRGEEGKMHLSVDSSFGITQPLRKLSNVDSYTYATLYNETRKLDNPTSEPAFNNYILDRFRLNDEPLLFPTLDWDDYVFKDFAWQTHHNVNLSGGSKFIKYFVSMGYLHEDGMLKNFDMDYDSNYKYNRFNYRANVDVNITGTTKLSLGIGGIASSTYEPKNWDIWEKIMWCTPYSCAGLIDIDGDGNLELINNGGNDYLSAVMGQNGLDLFYNYGFLKGTDNNLNLDIDLSQDLGFVTKGLSAALKGAYNTSYSFTSDRTPQTSSTWVAPLYRGTLTTPEYTMEDPEFDHTVIYKTDGARNTHERLVYWDHAPSRSRNWYLEAKVDYARSFADHNLTAMFLYNQTKRYYPSQYSDIPEGHLGYVGRITYNYKEKYMAEFNIGINGSENFAPDRRFGVFPAGSVGWVISDEDFARDWKALNFLKLRASFGLVGNDRYSGDRFLYLDGEWQANRNPWGAKFNGGTYQFGSGQSNTMLYDAIEKSEGNKEVTWEKCFKQNYGVDLKMLDYRLSLTADYFFEHRWDILSTKNTLPTIADISLPLINLGIIDNQGYEISLGWKDKIAGEVNYGLTFNMSYSRNKIIEIDEVVPKEPYMAQTGRPTGMSYGYLFDRYLRASDFDADGRLIEFDADGNRIIPKMDGLGTPREGDVLYKDLNSDGIIDSYDATYFGHSYRPDYTFGFLVDFDYKGWGLHLQFTAATGVDRVLYDSYRIAFGTDNQRALLKFLAEDRYTPENPDARFPRLSFTNRGWNTQTSDLWMLDGSYLRLKTMEISKTFNRGNSKFMKFLGLNSVKVYVSGYNLFTAFSELAKYDIDPEGITGDYNTGKTAYSYPNARIINFGLNLNF